VLGTPLRSLAISTATTPGRQRLVTTGSAALQCSTILGQAAISSLGKAADIAPDAAPSDWNAVGRGEEPKDRGLHDWCYLELDDLDCRQRKNSRLWNARSDDTSSYQPMAISHAIHQLVSKHRNIHRNAWWRLERQAVGRSRISFETAKNEFG